jgi:hypothetical protein
MLYSVHLVLIAVFVALPVVAVVVDAARARRRRKSAPSMPMLGTIVGGVVIGVALTVVYSIVMKGRASIGQMLLAVYFAFSLLLLLKGFDFLLRTGLVWAWMRIASTPIRDSVNGDTSIETEPVEGELAPTAKSLTGLTKMQPPPKHARRLPRAFDLAPALVRILILFGIALPYIMAAIMTYRPKVVPSTDPLRETGMTFEDVEFRASDGTRIAGWWIPAQVGRRVVTSERTLLLCHGLGSGKANMIRVARLFVPHGYNVLLFDFRAHGASDGQLTSFGDLERHDVLAAVRWVKTNRAEQSTRLLGLGASMGASALIMAAADEAQGRAIDAVVVYGTFDDLGALGRQVAETNFPPPLNWVCLLYTSPSPRDRG